MKRQFSTSAARFGKPGHSTVAPVHHLVRIKKSLLSPRFPELKYPKNDPRLPHFKPVNVAPCRSREHYQNTLKPDLMYMLYRHNVPEKVEGAKRREWDGTSPYHINRTLRKPAGFLREQPDKHNVSPKKIPEVLSVHLNCYVPLAIQMPQNGIAALLQLQQITGEKPTKIYSQSNIGSWHTRKGRQAGAKIELKGKPMYDFLATLTEVVLPRIPDFKGLKNRSGDGYGNIAFGLTDKQMRLFPELEANPDLWPKTFGMHVVINTSAGRNSEARVLLSGLGLPFFGKEKKERV